MDHQLISRKENLVCFDEGRKLAGTPSTQTLYRWATVGLKPRFEAEEGHRIFLEYCTIGRRSYTSMEAYDRFLRKLNGEKVPANG